ncbi:MAG TPA: pyridoxal phosphate-dependent aminotransferase [Bacteroidota bacterium]|jgi:hypothetical protein|nr:pyridoxal phosphate-dependent aminotransferase [Bacteroidota bacterium]
MFSSRTNWQRTRNRLTEAVEARRKSGAEITDLTVSNPTECGFTYPQPDLLASLSPPDALTYSPDPRGLLSARGHIANYYRQKNVSLSTSNVFLTSSTSEGYSLLLKLLCNNGDDVVVPSPSYPLFDYLARINDVHVRHYLLRYDGSWHLDLPSLRASLTPSTRAIVLVHPHNPTGMFIKTDELQSIYDIARAHNFSLIVDEVFLDYPLDQSPNRVPTTVRASDEVLTFTLSGISKLCGLPQMKLGWIALSGPDRAVMEASERLEILCDTFLSVSTPIQLALPAFVQAGNDIRRQILNRIKENYKCLSTLSNHLRKESFGQSPITNLPTEGGWYAILKVPRTKSDEEWALELLEKKNLYLYPGYFFDMVEEGHLVVSLLPRPEIFQKAVAQLKEHFS